MQKKQMQLLLETLKKNLIHWNSKKDGRGKTLSKAPTCEDVERECHYRCSLLKKNH